MKRVALRLADVRVICPDERGVLVTTDCLYPSLGSVVVVVIGGTRGETVTVHDDGGAAEQLVLVGRVSTRLSQILGRVARHFGLRTNGNAITSEPCPIEDVAAAVRMVANASEAAAQELLSASAPKAKRNLPDDVARAVRARNPDVHVQFDQPVVGVSSRNHWFDVLVPLGDGATLLVDAVTPDASSVNAAIVANFDVGRRRDARFVRAIVFDPRQREAFDPGSMALLAEAAPTTSVDDFAGWFDRSAKAA